METMNPNKKAKILEECENLMDLNDDCLLYLLRFFKLLELMKLRGISCRFDSLIFQSCKRFGTLNFKDLPDILKERFLEVLEFLGPAVKSLDMESFDKSYPNFEPSVILEWIDTHCVDLKRFRNSNIDLHESTAIQKFSPLVTRLKSLTLTGEICDNNLSDCFVDTSLEKLKVYSNHKITEKFFKNVSNLKCLKVRHCKNMIESSFIEVLKNNRNLKTLLVYIWEPTIEGNQELINFITENLHEIEDLEYYSLYINTNHLAELPNLKKLKLGQTIGKNRTELISEEINKLLEKLSQNNMMEELSVLGVRGRIDIGLLSKLTNLKLFSLNGGETLTNADLKKLGNLLNLEQLILPKVESLSMIRFLSKLEYLCIESAAIDVDILERTIQILRNLERPKLHLFVSDFYAEEQLERYHKLIKDNKNIIELSFAYSDMDTENF
ncbi:uncharacterized protein LOC134835220 [Culicoides brevitarsis]|uniref:uncharacterized protein LOC134835220 n=1 Tax=Culicoides brevitarsis TaxID=469753 RepID=UPI00307BAB22